MKFPPWAPADLVAKHDELKPKAAAEAARAAAGNIRVYDPREALERGTLHVGVFFIGEQGALRVLEPLITKPAMENVWRSLYRRKDSYKPVLAFPYGSREQGGSLYGTCMEIELKWSNLPKRTKAESKRYYETMASLALRLSELLLQDDHNNNLLDTRTYITAEQIDAFKAGLEKDNHEMWYGLDGYLDYLLGELIRPLPYYLLQLHHRAKECAALPLAVRQPNSTGAKSNYYIEHLSSYFRRTYGSPLHAHVATVVSTVLGTAIDEDRVRALLRSRKTGARDKARKKLQALKNNSSG